MFPGSRWQAEREGNLLRYAPSSSFSSQAWHGKVAEGIGYNSSVFIVP
jgi:hypothetical protein